MLPLRDDQPSYSTPFVNWFIIGLNILIYLFQASLGQSGQEVLDRQFGVIPVHLAAFLEGSHRYSLPEVVVPFFTSMFLHAGWMHVLGNMWFLYIFGDNVEDHLGHFMYLLFYLLCGLIAMSAQVAMSPHSNIPTLGASGAIAGILGAYFILYPRSRVLTWFPPLFLFYLPAWLVLGFWFVLQFLSGTASLSMMRSQRNMGGVAFWAHVGGFVAGMLLIKVFPQRRRRSPYAYE